MELTVAEYLIFRMEQLGIKQIFGVAGNYTAPFLNTIIENQSNIQIIRNTNEQVAGYAADGYARLKGPSAVYVTYSVGAYSAINAMAGSYTEQVPILLINGAPTNKEYSIERNVGLTYAHTTGDMIPDIEMYRNITVASERINNAVQAIFQIDSVLTAMITYNRPVYLEITEDVWRKNIQIPQDLPLELKSGYREFVTKTEIKDAIKQTFKLINANEKMIFWAGIEIQRKGLETLFDLMLNVVNEIRCSKGINNPIKFFTTPLSKSVLSEDHPFFSECTILNKKKVENLITETNKNDKEIKYVGCIVGFGAWTIGKDNGNQNIRDDHIILSAHDGLWVGAKYYPLISLKDFINQFIYTILEQLRSIDLIIYNEIFKKYNCLLPDEIISNLKLDLIQKNGINDFNSIQIISKIAPLNLDYPKYKDNFMNEFGYDSFITGIKEFAKDKPVVVDAGFPLISAQDLHIIKQSHFVAQASWLSIGYSLGALTGVALAYPKERAVCIVGDGAFQETCQAISDQIALNQNNVIFVLVNGVYGIEQKIVDPKPFTSNDIEFHDYNMLPKWDYIKLVESFGGKGIRIESNEQLQSAIDIINSDLDHLYIVEVIIPSHDSPYAIKKSLFNDNYEINLNREAGEDEIDNIEWPPINVY